jgi:hypothetical protein
MALTIVHAFQSAIADDATSQANGEVLPSHWNADHTISGTLAAADSTFTQAGSGASTRTVQDKLREPWLSIADYGAVADGTDCSTAFSAAFTQIVAAGGGTVFVPPGRWFVSGVLTLPDAPITIRGAGMDASYVYGARTSNLFFYDGSAAGEIADIGFEDLTIEGYWNTVNQNVDNRYPILIADADRLRVSRCRIKWSQVMGLAVRNSRYVSVTDCELWECARDGISTASCRYVLIANNRLDYIDDDAIASHGQADDVDGKPRDSIVIVGNRINQGAGGIRVIAARETVIASNQITRTKLHGIMCSMQTDYAGSSNEGRETEHSLVIANNVINDIFDRDEIDALASGATYIKISGLGTDGSGATIPGENIVTTGGFENLYTALDNIGAASSDTTALARARNIIIANNICTRTLYPTALYSDFGLGEIHTRSGYLDPDVTAAFYAATGLIIEHGLKNAVIEGNIWSGMSSTIGFQGTGAAAKCAFYNVLFKDNIITDNASAFAVVCSADVSTGQNVIFDGNVIDCDTFFTNASRSSNGSWATTSDLTAVLLQSAGGFVFSGNTFRNCSRISDKLVDAGSEQALWIDNIAECDPAAVGFSTSNKGIGTVPRAGRGIIHRIIECDSTSATYGALKNNCFLDRNAIPSTGTYVAGHFTKNNTPSASTPLGWLRLTTGTGHTLNTDWIEVDPVAMPASSTDNTLPRFDGTTGRILQTSGVTVDDSNNVTATSFIGPLTGNADTVTWANEATDTTCFIGFATAASGSLAPKTNTNLTFNSSTGVLTSASAVLTTADINGGTIDGATIGGSSAAAGTFTSLNANGGGALTGTWTDLGSVTTVDINGGTVDGAIIGGASAAAGTFTTATANSFVPNSSTIPSNGMYLGAANTLSWAINSAAELQLTGTALSPAADGGSSLGTTALGWQNLFGNTGFVLNIENSDWVATHTTGILTVGTGDLRVTTAGTNTASVVTVGGTQTLTSKTLTSPTIGTSPTAAGATWTDLGSVTTIDINGGTVDGVTIGGSSAGAITGTTITVNTSLLPDANDGAVLGASGTAFSDLFLASGAVINFDAGNVTLTHSANLVAINATGAYVQGSATLGCLLLGADVNAQTVTTTTRKLARVFARPYTNGQNNSLLFSSDNDGTNNLVYFGGTPGSSTLQAATQINFVTAAALNTNGGTQRFQIDANGNVAVGGLAAALATTATDGFLYIPTCAGTPTGAPTAKTGCAALVYDSTNNLLYANDGGGWVAANNP